MRIYNTYVVILGVAFACVNVLLAFAGASDLAVYFVCNTIAYLTITLLYVHFNPRTRMALNAIGAVLFGGFLLVMALKTLDVLMRR